MTFQNDDPRLAEAQALPIDGIVDRLEIQSLKRAGRELIGPCPECGGRDRFGVNLQKGRFLCRRCEAKGDGIALVMWLRRCTFPEALTWLCGPAEGISDAEREERRRKAEASRRRQEEVAAKERERSIRAARALYFAARPAEGTLVRDYLQRRGIPADLLPVLPPVLRFEPEARYTAALPGERSRYETIHVGPAMIAPIVDAQNRVTAVHRTWLDLDQPKGKLVLPDPHNEGALLPAKKVLGSKKGGAIRLHSPRDATTMIMAEGLENTLSALIAEPQPRAAAYWCGVDLGNMSGRRELGKGKKFAGIPDMTDAEAFVPPPWVTRLVFVQDGDSDPRLTRAKLVAGLRRAMLLRPGLRGRIVHPGAGRDINDILMQGGDNDHQLD